MVTILLAVIVDFQMSFGWSLLKDLFPEVLEMKFQISHYVKQTYLEILMNLTSSFLIFYIERSKKTWSQTVTNHVNALSIHNVDLLNRLVWWNALKTAASTSNPWPAEKFKDVKKKK